MSNYDHPLAWDHMVLFTKTLLEPEDVVEIRALYPNVGNHRGGGDSIFVNVGDFTKDGEPPKMTQKWLVAKNNPRFAGTYMTPHALKRKAGHGRAAKDDDVASFHSLFVDSDTCGPAAMMKKVREAGLKAPTLIVLSGRAEACHLYWKVAEGMDEGTWRAAMIALIEKLQTDPAIKNPSRIMRLPGTYNTTRSNTCRILAYKGEMVGPTYSNWADIGIQPDEMAQVPVFVNVGQFGDGEARADLLNKSATRYMVEASPPGERNNRLHAAARSYFGAGYSVEYVNENLAPLAIERDGLESFEVYDTIARTARMNNAPTLESGINSVDITFEESGLFNKTSQGMASQATKSVDFATVYAEPPKLRPMTPDEISGVPEVSYDPSLPNGGISSGTSRDPSNFSQDSVEALRPTLMNNILHEAESKDDKPWREYVSMNGVLNQVYNNYGGWPKNAGGLGLFYTTIDPHSGDEVIKLIDNVDALFGAFFHGRGAVAWEQSASCLKQGRDGENPTVVKPITKKEFYEAIKEDDKNAVSCVTDLPHEPPRPGYYYCEQNLPAPSEDLKVLYGFLDFFNPDTDIDRDMILATMLSPAAGMEPGTRPIMLITSDHGVGVGKSSTAYALADIYNGYFPLDLNGKTFAENTKAFFSSGHANKRLLIADNLKGYISGAELEASVSARTFEGHRMYKGTVERPNDIQLIITCNNAATSRDIADRCFVINIGPPQRGDFGEKVRIFMAEHRKQLLADIVALLKRPAGDPTKLDKRSRWEPWALNCLFRACGSMERVNEIMGLQANRRKAVDADSDMGIQFLRTVSHRLRQVQDWGDTWEGHVDVSQAFLSRCLTEGGMWADRGQDAAVQESKKVARYWEDITKSSGVLSRVKNESGKDVRSRVDERGLPTKSRNAARSIMFRFDLAKYWEVVGGDDAPDFVGGGNGLGV